MMMKKKKQNFEIYLKNIPSFKKQYHDYYFIHYIQAITYKLQTIN